MDQTFAFILLVSTFFTASQSTCQKKPSQQVLQKIEFDHQSVDSKGMHQGVIVDYEFCIPRNQEQVDEIKSIAPEVLISQTSQGRIRCSREEYLCIVSAADDKWKEQLYRIAGLDYVKRIIRTYYE